MKVFISWSGDYSRAVAELLKSWLEDVFQGMEAWMSKEDISKGEIWFTGLSDTLAKTDFGILCLTSQNVAAPWILFEAGALSKGLSKNRVCPLVIDFEPASLTPPLSQFNATRPTKGDMLKLAEAINSQGERILPPEKLSKTFERWWGDFEAKFGEIKDRQRGQPAPLERSIEEMVIEILETVRALQKANQKPDRASLVDLLTPECRLAPNFDNWTQADRVPVAWDLYRQALEEYRAKLQKSSTATENNKQPEK